MTIIVYKKTHRSPRLVGDMCHILLANGLTTILDATDYSLVQHQNNWFTTNGYASYSQRTKESKIIIYLHLLLILPPKDMTVDHWDRNKLNNTRKNLRVCTKSQNHANTPRRLAKSSKYKGVHWSNSANRWIAQISINGKPVFLGSYNNEIEAAKRYDKEALIIFKDFAYLNF